jgi:hypothetical protein
MKALRPLLLRTLASGLIYLFATPLATAATVTQTFNFPYTYSELTPSSSQQLASFPTQFSTSVIPFDPSRGTLESVVITWVFGAAFSGVAGTEGIAGSVNLSMSAATRLDEFPSYNGGGTGGGDGDFSGLALSVNTPEKTVSRTFTQAGDGTAYPTGMWAVLSADAAYDAILAFGSGTYFNYTNVSSGAFTFNADLTVDYNYIAAVPEPATLLSMSGLLGGGLLLRRRSKRGF